MKWVLPRHMETINLLHSRLVYGFLFQMMVKGKILNFHILLFRGIGNGFPRVNCQNPYLAQEESFVSSSFFNEYNHPHVPANQKMG